ncbi:MAG: glycosyltransferase family 2 protein [Deltaproteobacteria bacterium]|nr:glycosyltransferase family 2 protein [Deltaproteobacteria bacterium]
MKNLKLLILVPVFNEWPHLLSVLQNLRKHFPHILVIDDGSDDKSYLSLLKKEGFEYIDIPFNLGHWCAIQTGFKYALTKGYDSVITFDGDGQHLSEGALRIVPSLEQGCDVVIGKDNDRGGWSKKFCWGMLNRLSGLDINDFTSGLRGYSRAAMGQLTHGSFLNLDYQDLGVLFMAKKKGLQLMEVPVKMETRLGEKSKVFPNFTSVIRYLFITLTFIIARRL